MSGDEDLQECLSASRSGDESARNRLYDAIHAELSAIASQLLRREYRPVSLSTGDLVNEAVLRLMSSDTQAPEDRAHFLALAAQVMRHVLIDAARKRNAEKRRKVTVTLNTEADAGHQRSMELSQLEAALVRLKAVDEHRAEIVVLRYYGGMTTEEIAVYFNVSESTVKRSWRAACAWLKDAIENDVI